MQVRGTVYGVPSPSLSDSSYDVQSGLLIGASLATAPVPGATLTDSVTLNVAQPGTLWGILSLKMPNGQTLTATSVLGTVGIRTDDVAVLAYLPAPVMSTAPDPRNPTLLPAGIDGNLKNALLAGVQAPVLSMFKPNLTWGGTASDLAQILSGNYPYGATRLTSAWAR